MAEFFGFFANLFGYILNIIYSLVNNYGIAIIIFTILLKLIMLPISIKQQKTMKKTAKVQVKVKELQEKYSNDPVRLNQEMMDLYKQEDVSPFSGCLSSIIQIIIVLSIFFLVSKPLTYMNHIDSETINKYTQEITEEKGGETPNYIEIAIIKEKSDEDPNVNLNMDFLGLDLSDIPMENYTDLKVFIIPVLYVLTSMLSTKITTSLNKKPKEEIEVTEEEKTEEKKEKEEDAMEEMNRQMNLMMPIMSVSIAIIAPLGLALYWLVSNLLMIIERLIINKVCKDEEE